MATDQHYHETIKYMGKGAVDYPSVMPDETPMQVAIREAGRTIRPEALTAPLADLFWDYATGSGMLFRKQHADIQRHIAHVSSIYGLTA